MKIVLPLLLASILTVPLSGETAWSQSLPVDLTKLSIEDLMKIVFSMTHDHAELKLLTLEEAATILQISKRTLLRMIERKEVPAFKVEGQWRIRESQFRKWVEDKEN